MYVNNYDFGYVNLEDFGVQRWVNMKGFASVENLWFCFYMFWFCEVDEFLNSIKERFSRLLVV